MEGKSTRAQTIPELSVVVPAYNEEARITATLEKICAFMDASIERPELIIVDDGSSDQTVRVVERFIEKIPYARIIEQGVNRGKGAAVRAGVLDSSRELVLFSDADLSTPIEDFLLLYDAIQQGPRVAVGSRGMKESRLEIRQPWYREMMGRIFNKIVRFVLPLTLQDTQCGFKLFALKEAKALFGALKTEGFAFDVELIYRAHLGGIQIAEIPVTWRNDEASRVRAIQDSAHMFAQLLSIRVQVLKDKKAGCLLNATTEE